MVLMKKVTTSLSTDETLSDEDQVFFSIIVPMYNRATTIRRCLESALSQDFTDYEIIIVDDGSEDDSVAVVESYLPDPHVTLVKSQENCGVCAARGLGVRHARGRWIMFIDSDDAFHPGALQTIYEETNKAPAEVSEIRFCYFCEAIGKVTPIPMMPQGILGFPEYLKWLEELFRLGNKGNSDLLYCQRREIYNLISWPTDREYELLYHLELASKIKVIMSRKVVGTMHDDAPERITKSNNILSRGKSMAIAGDNANSNAKLLMNYGKRLKRHCPSVYEYLHNHVGELYMRSGEKAKGCRYLLKYIGMRPFSLTGWGMLILGLMGPDMMSWGRRKFGKKIRAIGKKLGVE